MHRFGEASPQRNPVVSMQRMTSKSTRLQTRCWRRGRARTAKVPARPTRTADFPRFSVACADGSEPWRFLSAHRGRAALRVLPLRAPSCGLAVCAPDSTAADAIV